MQDIVRTRLLLFLLGLIVVPIGTVLVVLFAKGYRPDLQKGAITVTGLLVANSYPEGAQLFINGKLNSATNTTINLPPGYYAVEIKKDGYQSWHKELVVQPEIVTRATAVLFPSVPTLKPITTNGAADPVLSPDGTKAAFTSLTGQQLYTLDLTESPLGLLNREAKLAADFRNSLFKISGLIWSPDSRLVMAYSPGPELTASSSAYLIDPSNQQLTNVTDTYSRTLSDWNLTSRTHELQKLSSLPPILQNILATASADLVWSPNENKLLYTATASAALPAQLKKPLAGSDNQPQERILIPGHVYVYDTEEDRNFKIDDLLTPTPTPKPSKTRKSPVASGAVLKPQIEKLNPSGWMWFPTSSHLYKVEHNKITIKEYDNTNSTVVYAGPLEDKSAIPYPSAKQMLILTNLNATPITTTPGRAASWPDLYALSLR